MVPLFQAIQIEVVHSNRWLTQQVSQAKCNTHYKLCSIFSYLKTLLNEMELCHLKPNAQWQATKAGFYLQDFVDNFLLQNIFKMVFYKVENFLLETLGPCRQEVSQSCNRAVSLQFVLQQSNRLASLARKHYWIYGYPQSTDFSCYSLYTNLPLFLQAFIENKTLVFRKKWNDVYFPYWIM